MDPDEIQVSTEEKTDSNEPIVNFIEDDHDNTLVQIEEKKDGNSNRGASRDDEERWRRAEADNLRLQASLADLQSRVVGNSGPGRQAQPDPFQQQEDAIAEQERALGIQWEAHKAARSLTPELLKDFDGKSRSLQQQRMNIAAQRAIQGTLPTIIQATQQQQFAREYGDVQSNPAANRFARGEYDRLVARGAPETPETVARAMNAARVEFRMPTARYQPTEQDRQQLTGFGGQGRRVADPKSNVVKMGKSEKIMAMAMYGERFNGDEKKVYSQWAKGPGIRAQRAAARARRGNQTGY